MSHNIRYQLTPEERQWLIEDHPESADVLRIYDEMYAEKQNAEAMAIMAEEANQ